jgi:membrane protein DedA with SNARE-associated domain
MLEAVVNTVFDLGYLGFFFYMIVVGTFIPLPTQLILIPSGYLISQGKLDFATIVVVTSMGTTIGALINYHLSNFLSKKIMNKSKLEKIEIFFNKYGKVAVFLAPLTFGLGQYISIPAGVAKMPLRWFMPLIFLSNSIWNSAMLLLGYLFGTSVDKEVTYLAIGGVVFVVIIISSLIYKEIR